MYDPRKKGKGVVPWRPVISWWRASHNNRLLEIEVNSDETAWWYVTDAQGKFLTGGPALTVSQAKRYAQEAADGGYPNKPKRVKKR